MKRFIAGLLCFAALSVHGQQWAFLKGNPTEPRGIYMAQGVGDHRSQPGARKGAALCMLGGKLYLFGGYGGSIFSTTFTNDLWEYDPTTRRWVWLTGSVAQLNPGVYGTQGTAASGNTPGARHGAVAWAMGGKMYLFGGNGYTNNTIAGPLNDLWEYNPATGLWTWLKGGNTTNSPAVYGTQGVAAPANTPGPRNAQATWTYGNKLYFFGGGDTGSPRNDLWEYDPAANMWRWVSGSSSISDNGWAGVQGVAAPANRPHARFGPTAWQVGTKAYIFGGCPGIYQTLNDVWEYDYNTGYWTWLHGDTSTTQAPIIGTPGVAAPANTPGSRVFCAGWSGSNVFYLQGGTLNNSTTTFASDTWEFNLTTKQWRMRSGTLAAVGGTYGVRGVGSLTAHPGARAAAQVAQGGNTMYMYGGVGLDQTAAGSHTLSDLWSFNTATGQYAWVDGSHYNTGADAPGYAGMAAYATAPGKRSNHCVWEANGNLYAFGGTGNDRLWKYTPSTNEWTWIKGDTAAAPVYGTQGIAVPGNTPGARTGAASWTANGKFYLYGGTNTMAQYDYLRADLWEYDPATNLWRWIAGPPTANATTQSAGPGIPAASNYPGARARATAVTIGQKLYLFGGEVAWNSRYADLWSFDLAKSQWTHVKGPTTAQAFGVYGTMGTGTATTRPGSRRGAAGWAFGGKFYLYSGYGLPQTTFLDGVYLSDMWEYNPATGNWTWIYGTNGSVQYPQRGTQNVESSFDRAGSREGAAAWVQGSRMALMGGYFIDANNQAPLGEMNDVWEFNPATNLWRWTSGTAGWTQPGQFLQPLVPDTGNRIGARCYATATPLGGAVYVFGGKGMPAFQSNVSEQLRDDLWAFYPCATGGATCPPVWPAAVITVNGQSVSTIATCPGVPVMLNAGAPGSRYLWSTGDTTQSIFATMPGTYIVTATAPDNNISSDTITVTAGTGPAINLGPDGGLCVGSTQTLNAASPGAAYLWSTGAATPTITVSAAGLYYVQAVDAAGCLDADTIALSPLAIPTVDITSTSSLSFCPGDSAVFSGAHTSIASYSWSTGATTSTTAVYSSGPVVLTGTGANGCSAADTVVVTVLPAPMVNLGADTTLCPGAALTLNATTQGATSYYWLPGGQGAAVITANTPGTYVVRVLNSSNCVAYDTVVVNAGALPSASGIAASVSSATASFSITAPQAVAAYAWSFGDGGTSTAAAPSHTYVASGTFSVRTVLSNGCGADTLYRSVTVSLPTGMSKVEEDAAIRVFPNPVREALRIESGALFLSRADLRSADGARVLTVTLDSKGGVVPVTGIAPGSYWLIVEDRNGGMHRFRVQKLP